MIGAGVGTYSGPYVHLDLVCKPPQIDLIEGNIENFHELIYQDFKVFNLVLTSNLSSRGAVTGGPRCCKRS